MENNFSLFLHMKKTTVSFLVVLARIYTIVSFICGSKPFGASTEVTEASKFRVILMAYSHCTHPGLAQ